METTFPPNAADHPPPSLVSLSKSQIRRAVLASVIGNGLEWFDFLIYGYFAKIIAHVFFPVGNTALSTALTLGTFAVGFIVRPLGGIAIGAYADRVGRRKTLSMLILLMAASTLLMGLTPGCSSIGIAGPLLVLLARVYTGRVCLSAASSPPLRRCSPNTRRAARKMYFGSFQIAHRRRWRSCFRRRLAIS